MRLFLLPGLGATAAVFRAQQKALPQLTAMEWPAPRRGESLRQYAVRIAECLPRDEPLAVGGMSLGGMVAVETARALGGIDCALIATVTGPRRLPVRVRAALAVGRFLPLWVWRVAQCIGRGLVAAFGRFFGPVRRELLEEFAVADPQFLHWAVRALAAWDESPYPLPRVHQLHGSRDRIIPPACAPGARIVEGGGHVLPLTHPQAVDDFLRGIVEFRAG